LALPAVAHVQGRQCGQGRRSGPVACELECGAGARVLAVGEAEASQEICGLANRGQSRILGDRVLEGLLGPLTRLGRGARGLGLGDEGPGLGQWDRALGLGAGLPARPAAPPEPEHGDGRHRPDGPQNRPALAELLDQAHRRSSSSSLAPALPIRAGSARSSQISPLTEEPSAAEKLPALRVPVSTPLGRMSRWVVAERVPRTLPAITMAAALMLASTWAASATTPRPATSISPSKRP